VARKPRMVAAVALANKMARMIWATTTKQEDYPMACPSSRDREEDTAWPQGRGERSTRRRRHGLRSSRWGLQLPGSSASCSLNRCEPSLPNSTPARGVMEHHDQRPDTRPIEDTAEKSQIMLAKQGASTHAYTNLCRGTGPHLRGYTRDRGCLTLQSGSKRAITVLRRTAPPPLQRERETPKPRTSFRERTMASRPLRGPERSPTVLIRDPQACVMIEEPTAVCATHAPPLPRVRIWTICPSMNGSFT
jgi:hypothetical protein